MGAGPRGARDSWEMRDIFVRLFDAVIPCLNGVCVPAGLRAVSAVCVPRRSLVCVTTLTLCFASRSSFCCSKCWWASGFADSPVLSARPEETDVHGRCPGAVCVMDLCSFLAMKGSKGSASPLGLGCAGLCRCRCGSCAWPEGNGWRKGCPGGSWTACAGGSNTERAPLSPREVETRALGSQHKLQHFWDLLQTGGRGYSSDFLWSHGVLF